MAFLTTYKTTCIEISNYAILEVCGSHGENNERTHQRKIEYLFSYTIVNLTIGFFYVYRTDLAALVADELAYVTLAHQISSGSLEWDGRRALGFPLLLSLLVKLLPGVVAVQIVISALAATAVPLLYSIIQKSSGNTKAAITGSLALALWPPALFYGNSLYSETIALPLFLLSLYLLPTTWGKGSTETLHFASGICLGLTIHMRPMYLIFIPFLFAFVIFETPKFHDSCKRTMAILLGLTLTILPWSIYASKHLGQPVLVTAAVGETLAGGLNQNLFSDLEGLPIPGARQAWVGPGKWLPMYMTGYLSESELKKPYIVQTRLAGERAKDWILRNPADAAYLQFRKVMYMWGIYPVFNGGITQVPFGNPPILALLGFTITLLVKTPWEKSKNWRFS